MTTPYDSPRAREDEQFEHIPWEHLSAASSNRRWWVYLGAGALVLAALTASIVRNSSASRPPLTAAAVTTLTTSAVIITEALPMSSTTTAAYSEADLMAIAPASLLAEAATMAEWIAADFFTIDGSGSISSDLALAFPIDSVLPSSNHGHRSYVEWARAAEVEETTGGAFQVLVILRMLGAEDGENYRRLQPKAVWLSLQWTPEGWSLLDLPSAGQIPTTVQMPAWPTSELPPEVTAAATMSGSTVLSGGRVGQFWRVVVEEVDGAGGRWPLVSWFDGEGRKLAEPPPGQLK